MIILLTYLLWHAADDSPSVSPVICRLMLLSIQLCNLLGKFTKNTCSPSSLSQPIFLGNQNSHWSCVSLSPSTDSMIRVGGDYQAQIPEFKPGKLAEERGRGMNREWEEIRAEKETWRSGVMWRTLKWRKEGNTDDERNEGQMTCYCGDPGKWREGKKMMFVSLQMFNPPCYIRNHSFSLLIL